MKIIEFRATTTDTDGSYSYTCDVSESGAWSNKSSWEGDALHCGATSQTVSFTVIEALSYFGICVRDVEGDRIEGASVSSTNTPSGQSSMSGSTDTNGAAHLNDVKTGSYTFEVSKSRNIAKSETVTAESGETNELSLILERAPSERKGIPGFPYKSICLGLLESL